MATYMRPMEDSKRAALNDADSRGKDDDDGLMAVAP